MTNGAAGSLVEVFNEAMRDESLRIAFEKQTCCSFGFKRSRKGNYVSPATSLKWRWFLAGVKHAETGRDE